jgi:hypothetical protein
MTASAGRIARELGSPQEIYLAVIRAQQALATLVDIRVFSDFLEWELVIA